MLIKLTQNGAFKRFKGIEKLKTPPTLSMSPINHKSGAVDSGAKDKH